MKISAKTTTYILIRRTTLDEPRAPSIGNAVDASERAGEPTGEMRREIRGKMVSDVRRCEADHCTRKREVGVVCSDFPTLSCGNLWMGFNVHRYALEKKVVLYLHQSEVNEIECNRCK